MKTEKPDPPEPPPRNPLRVMASLSSEVNLHFIKNLFQCANDDLTVAILRFMQKNAITPEGPIEAEADSKSPDTKDPKDLPKVDEKKEGQSITLETADVPKGSGKEKLISVAAQLLESFVTKFL